MERAFSSRQRRETENPQKRIWRPEFCPRVPKVLLVDDDLLFGHTFSTLADRSQKVDLTYCRSFSEWSEKMPGHWDIALVDCGLGEKSGFDVAHLLAQARQPTPVWLISHNYPEIPVRHWPGLVRGFLHKDAGCEVLWNAALDALGEDK